MRVTSGRVEMSWSRAVRGGLGAALVVWGMAAGAQAPACDFCGTGRHQSPVRLEAIVDTSAAGPRLAYKAETVTLRNTGRTLYVHYPQAAESGMEFDAPGNRHALVEFHFHAPGEHAFAATAPGKMEVHFVHRRGAAIAVLGVPIALGASTHPTLKALFGAIPVRERPHRIEHFDALDLAFHEGARLLRYAGSLTTGKCDEGVSWFVYDAQAPLLTVSAEDYARYRRSFPSDYARAIQPLHARQILRVGPPSAPPR